MWFHGADWGVFRVFGAWGGGRILIQCNEVNGSRFYITISRWLDERRKGAITPGKPV